MLMFRAAFAAAVVAFGAVAPSRAADSLHLDDAFDRAISSHPDLAVLRHTQAGLEAEVARAAQAPSLAVVASAENVLGSGAASGVNGAELTLSLASVLERGGKRAARMRLADQRLAAVELLRDGKRLDLLAEVARRFLDVAAAQANETIAREDLTQRGRTVDAAARRVAAGGAPESVHLAAQAAQIRSRGEVERAVRARAVGLRRLGVLWGDDAPTVERVAGDLERVPVVPAWTELRDLLERSPELRRFAHEARLREARVQLARTARQPDVEWELGVRRLQADSDWGLVGSVSVPLGSRARAEPEIRVASAELAALELEREGQARTLEATLAQAWGQLDSAVADATRIERELLPQLARAERAAERAYRAGALSYLEWAQLQTETSAARRERLDALVTAWRALIELQRLTGDSLRFAEEDSKEHAP